MVLFYERRHRHLLHVACTWNIHRIRPDHTARCPAVIPDHSLHHLLQLPTVDCLHVQCCIDARFSLNLSQVLTTLGVICNRCHVVGECCVANAKGSFATIYNLIHHINSVHCSAESHELGWRKVQPAICCET